MRASRILPVLIATASLMGALPAIVAIRAAAQAKEARAEMSAGATQAAADRLLATIRVLSSDEFEGRGPGTAGEEKATAYLTAQFKELGLAPGNPNGTYLQDVPMVGITSKTVTTFQAGATTLTPAWINDYIAVSHRVAPSVSVADSPIVFAGYGVVAPEYGWDDFKGVDVRGKTVIVLVNDPPVPDPKDPSKLDDTMFKGKAMTYYGRWMYKYEEASRLGAAACLIVHETGPAGYPFAVIAVSQGRENFDLQTADGNASHVAVEGWLTLDGARKLFAAAGYDFAQLKAAAVSRDFRPVDLHARASFQIANTIRSLDSKNVVARLRGSDPKRADEYVIYTAHWDHLGRDPRLKGDQIFNGAADNAAGCAELLEIARSFVALPPGSRPRRSILFLSVTGEEKGLLGSLYYAEHPLYPLNRTLANINMDDAPPLGPARDLEVVGYGNSTLDDLAAGLLARDHRVLRPDTQPEKGSFYRSDHFEFAKVGVPAFYSKGGVDIIGQPAGYGQARRDEYIANDYHKVTDEIKPWWDLRGTVADGQLLFALGLEVAQGDPWPTWKPGCEFKAARDAMMAAAR
jgi:Zn-dependent M28 family amino/carboxypeptidase